MKKSLVALAALAAVGIASAQSTATISGQFRLGYKSDADGKNSVTPDQASGNVMNFNVTEDLGGGLSAFASTQIRFDAANGEFINKSGPAADKAGFHLAFLGLRSTKLGTLQSGRFALDQLHSYNAFGTTGATLTGSLAGVTTIGGSTENGVTRYTSPSFMGFNVALAASPKANNTAAGTTSGGKQVVLNYANGPIAATFVRENNVKAQKFEGLGASYDLKVAKVFVTVAEQKTAAGAKEIDRYSLSAQAPVGPFVAKVGYSNDQLAVNRDKTSLALDYALSKRTTVEVQTYKVKNLDRKQSMFVGIKHTY